MTGNTATPTHRHPYAPTDERASARLHTVAQLESKHPALAGRLRRWIYRADAGDPTFVGLRRAIVRVSRSLFINEYAFDEWLAQRAAMPPAASRKLGPSP